VAHSVIDALTPAIDRQVLYGLQSPNRARMYLEARAIVEIFTLLPAAPFLLAQHGGDGRQVMLVPGFRADDISTWPLRAFLTYLGYDALPWELGRNNGQPERDAGRLIEKLTEVRRTDEPITLIGWSLGGVIAREVARRDAEAVREVITLGTPVEGGPKYTVAGERFARQHKIDLEAFERHVHEINRQGITRPLTIIYSHGDGIVDWRAAIDRYNPHARHERVVGSHLGLGVNPLVWWIIARTLSASASA
jgi:pimeloyl-ACP methyl ester carboxylesterase